MSDRNPLEIMYILFTRLIQWASAGWEFMFKDHKIGLQAMKVAGNYLIDLTITINLFDALLGGLGLTILVMAIVKMIIPVA